MLRTPSLLLVASLASAIAFEAGAQTALPGYAAGTARYRIVTTVSATQGAMLQAQTSESKTEEVHTVVLTKSGTGFSQAMTFDSASFTSNPPAPSPDAAALQGLRYTATMASDGKVTTSTVTDKSGAAAAPELADMMRSFLPRLKEGAAVGATWSDSSVRVRRQNAADVTTNLISNFKLVGDTLMSGAHAWKITAESSGKVSGAGNQQGADYTINGTVTGHGTIVISAAGVLLDAQLLNDVNMVVDVPMASMQIPIVQKQTTTITKLP
jgi:hypothetical protein